jgi:protein involved in polysaccharide export with SLBB domain
MKSARIVLQILISLAIFGLGLTLVPGNAEGQTAQVDSLRRIFSLEPLYRDYSEPIDPNLYLIRPGEIITAVFIGSKIPSQSFTVNPEGFVIEPSLGKLMLAGKTLTEARKELTSALSKLFNTREIAFSVSKPRLITITVTGEVQHPGAYTLYSSQHVSEVIAMAGGVKAGGSTRMIRFLGGDTTVSVDLDRASFLGEVQFDPLLYVGSRIDIPARSQDLIHVVGEVTAPRVIELLPADSLKLLIGLAGGVTGYGDMSAIHVIGTDGSNTLKAGGTLIVPPLNNLRSVQQISIFGAVAKPGRFDTTGIHTLGQLIQTAGGFLEEAVQERTVVFRRIGTNAVGQITDTRYPIVFIDQQQFSLSAFELRAGDSVVVQTAHGFVQVTGQVRNPGIVPFVANKTVDWYINSVGGFLPNADRQQLLIHHPIANTMTAVTRQTLVRDGDQIIVELREEFK